MIKSLKKFLALTAVYALLSTLIAAFNTFSIDGIANIGSLVGAAAVLLGSGRLMADKNVAMESIAMQQRLDAAYGAPEENRGRQRIDLTLPAGALLFSGLAWLVAMQATLYLRAA